MESVKLPSGILIAVIASDNDIDQVHRIIESHNSTNEEVILSFGAQAMPSEKLKELLLG